MQKKHGSNIQQPILTQRSMLCLNYQKRRFLSVGYYESQEHITEVSYGETGHAYFCVEDGWVLFYASEVSVLEYACEDGGLEE